MPSSLGVSEDGDIRSPSRDVRPLLPSGKVRPLLPSGKVRPLLPSGNARPSENKAKPQIRYSVVLWRAHTLYGQLGSPSPSSEREPPSVMNYTPAGVSEAKQQRCCKARSDCDMVTIFMGCRQVAKSVVFGTTIRRFESYHPST